MRLIDADALVEAIKDYPYGFRGMIVCDIAKQPTIEPKKVKWIKNDGRHGWHCPVCGEDDLYAFAWNSDTGENELQDRYCPNCGARMDL